MLTDTQNNLIEEIRTASVTLWNDFSFQAIGKSLTFPECATVEAIQAACTVLQDPDDGRTVVQFNGGQVEAILMSLELMASTGRLTEWEISVAEALAGQSGLERLITAQPDE